MAQMIDKNCKCCGTQMRVRIADHKRGWGNYCSKTCKARHQTAQTGISRPDYRAGGKTVRQMRNGDYAKSRERRFPTIVSYDEWDDEVLSGNVKYSHKHGCWLVRDDGSDPLIDAHPFDSDAAGFNNS